MRRIWSLLGVGLIGVAAAGAILPGIPTAPFILLAGACFSRSSQRLHAWLRNHRRFGTLLRDWEEHGAIGRRARWAAIGLIILVGGVSLWFLDWRPGQIALGLLLVGAIVFLGTRPDPPHEAAPLPGGSVAREGET